MELLEKNHHLPFTIVILDSGNKKQHMLKPMGKSVLKNKILTWFQGISA